MILKTDSITLTQLLKLEGFLESGGQAKHFLQEETVLVNDERETRRNRKLFVGDVVKLGNHTIYITNEV